MTPEQLRDIAAQIMRHKSTVAVEGVVPQWLHDQLHAHAAALEENARVRDELLGVKEYREKNPLGGPAKVFDAMADQIRAGEDFNKVIADYGWCPAERAERAEAALAEAERKIERLKFHAEAMAHYTDCYASKWPDSGANYTLEAYRAEFKEE